MRKRGDLILMESVSINKHLTQSGFNDVESVGKIFHTYNIYVHRGLIFRWLCYFISLYSYKLIAQNHNLRSIYNQSRADDRRAPCRLKESFLKPILPLREMSWIISNISDMQEYKSYTSIKG